MRRIYTLLCILLGVSASWAQDAVQVADTATIGAPASVAQTIDVAIPEHDLAALFDDSPSRLTLYEHPYSRTLSKPDWRRLWVNTGVLMGAGISTMVILEALPENATAWNRHANASASLFHRWWQHVRRGPVWDGDNGVFNYILHPYAGAAYYMGARSCGFNCLGAFVYSFCISNFFWEYGFEAFNEIPSVQDIIITPFVGSLMGEGFYLVKRHIVSHGYRLWGSKVLGYVVAFLVDPINEVVGYFYGDQRHHTHIYRQTRTRIEGSSWIGPTPRGLSAGLSLTITF